MTHRHTRTVSQIVRLAMIVLLVGSHTAAGVSKPWPRQLRGISSVNLYVHMPPSIEESSDLADGLRPTLERILNEGGIATISPSNQTLALDVDAFSCGDTDESDLLGVRVMLRLTEPVILARHPDGTEFDKMPIVWFEERLFSVRRERFADKIRKLAQELVGEFAGWVKIQTD